MSYVQKKRDKREFFLFVPSSDLDWIQTSNLLSRNQVRYSVAPQGHFFANAIPVKVS